MNQLAPAVALAHQAKRRQQPLDYWRCSSWAQERIIREVVAGTEVYAHAGNRAGKTAVGCVLDLSFVQGREFLYDRRWQPIPLPVLEPPVLWGVGMPSYKLGGATVIEAFRKMLGDWPAHEEKAGGPDSVAIMRVRHRLSRSDTDWSRIYFFPYDGPPPEGPGLDGWHCDEPPPPQFLSAFRFRQIAGRYLRGYITATPLQMRAANGVPGWEPILARYPSELLTNVRGRMRIQWSVLDNEALSAAEKRSLVEKAEDEGELARAKLHGDHVDMTGGNPFDQGALKGSIPARIARCRPAARTMRLEVQAETQSLELGIVLQPLVCLVDLWGEDDPTDAFLVVLDPAKGIRDGKHDPDGAELWSRRRKKQVGVMFGQYVGAWALGQAGVALARHFRGCTGGALLKWERNGIGEVVSSSIRATGYQNLWFDRRASSRTHGATLYGYHQTHDTRSEAIAAIEQALLTGSAEFSDVRVLQQLAECVIDKNGKIVAGPQTHDEHLILSGMALAEINYRLDGAPAIAEEQPSALRERFREAVRQDLGVDVVGDTNGYGSAFDDLGRW